MVVDLVGVSTNEYINTARFAGNGGVADIFLGFAESTEMAQTNDDIAMERIQRICHLLRYRNGVKVHGRFEILVRDDAFRVTTETENTYLEVSFMNDGESLLEVPRQGCPVRCQTHGCPA